MTTSYNTFVDLFLRTRRHAVKTSDPSHLAYSYLRFSSPAQADGDSVRRQTALRDDWLRRHPEARLDTSLRLEDRGVSGYRGEHRTNGKHALASFVDLVRRGRVPAGAYLIVENLDRLTRENPVVSIPAVLELIGLGVRVVQLTPVEIVYDADMDQSKLMFMLWELARGHGESRRKSGLCGEAWSTKKAEARADKTPHGAMCPAWLELAGGNYRVKEDAARAVRKIFQWCAAGLGTFGVLDRLNREGVPPFGRSGRWERSYVRKILTNPAVMGTYQPCAGHRDRKPEGEPVPGYYPAVIDEPLWYAAQAAMKARARRSGRPATGAVNPFSGLLRSATDGAKLHVCGSRGHKYLVSAAAVQKHAGAKWQTFPLPTFVAEVLSQLRELGAADLFAEPGGAKVAELTGRLADVDRRLAAALERFEADPESPTWAERVSQYDRDKRALVKDLAEARQAVANPLSGTWAEAVGLMAQEEPERLRAALLATIEGIWCVFVGRDSLRLAAVQVRFVGGDQRRDYLIAHRGATGGAVGARPAQSWCRSLASVAGPGDLDLRRPEHAARLEKVLAGVDLAALGG
jgi:DNA invertase Pin-like site-specific DNA recombinase